MRLYDIIKLAFLNSFRRRVRSILTAFSIMIGVSSVLLVSYVGSTGELLVTNELEKLGLQGISIHQSKDENSKPLYEADLKKLEKKFKNISVAMPIVVEFSDFKMNKVNSNAIIFGVGEKADEIYKVTVLYGRIPNQNDILSKRRVAVIDEELAQKTYKRSNVVGKKIVLKYKDKTENFEIIGVIKSQKDGINSMLGNNIPDFIYMPYSTINEIRGSEKLSQITLKCIDGYISDGKEYAEYLSKIKSAPNGYVSENISTRVNEVKYIINIISLLMSTVAGISLFVAGFGVMNTMFSSTAERNREIGICIAVGAMGRDILLIFLFESIIISLIGGTVGALIGFAITYVISIVLKINYICNIKSFLIAEFISFICGALFSILPAAKAAKLDPIVALRRG